MLNYKHGDQVFNDSCKVNLNISPSNSQNYSTYNYGNQLSNAPTQSNTPADFIIQEVEQMDNKNICSSMSSAMDSELDIYSSNNNYNNNYECFLNIEREINNNNDPMYGNANHIWNFEDYFTI